MGERNMSIVFSSGIRNLVERNSSFDSGVLRVAYTGKNRNNSFISKETFERCMPSIYNCPIVCNYDRESDTIGSHDMELISDDNGMRIVNITQPVGVIPESAKYWWEEIEDDSGLHEYLCVDALIWKRQEAYRKIKDDGITDESMEITVKEGGMVDGVYVIDRFEFTAFCLLGTAKPCYESASLEMFSCDDFKQQLAMMMREFKDSFTTAQPSQEVGIHPQNYSEGGEEVLEQKVALMAEFGLTADMLDFNIEEFSVEELRTKFEELKPPLLPQQNPRKVLKTLPWRASSVRSCLALWRQRRLRPAGAWILIIGSGTMTGMRLKCTQPMSRTGIFTVSPTQWMATMWSLILPVRNA